MNSKPLHAASARRRLTLTLLSLGMIGGAISAGAVLSGQHVFFDLLSHFRIQYIVLLLPLLLVAAVARRFVAVIVLASCLAIHLVAVYQSQQRVPIAAELSAQSHHRTLRVMSSNLLASNQGHDKQISLIHSANPDVIVFQEYTPVWHSALSAELGNYPHRITAALNNPFGIAIYSKHAFTDAVINHLFPGSSPSAAVTLSVAGKAVEIFGTHPPPPMSASMYHERNRHLQKLAAHAKARSHPLVIAGDLNTSPWSQSFQQFLERGNLYDARAGKGLFPTWPAFFSPLQIPIDYILVSKHFKVTSMNSSSDLSSDHKSVWATLQF